jgi:hypothetical protein
MSFKIETAYHFPITIPDATTTQDGVMTKQQVIDLNNAVSGGVLTVSGTAPITSSGGANPTVGISPATPSDAGSMSAADKTKLDGITPGAAVASVNGTAPITSSGGANPTVGISPATPSDAGSMSAADKTKLDSLTPAPPQTQFRYFAQTVGATSATVDTYTLAPDSSAYLKITVSVVSDFFSRGGFFTANILAQRNGAGNGDVNSYTLTNTVLDASLTAPQITIQAINLLVGGVLQILVNGKAGKTIDWTVTVEPYVATQGQ